MFTYSVRRFFSLTLQHLTFIFFSKTVYNVLFTIKTSQTFWNLNLNLIRIDIQSIYSVRQITVFFWKCLKKLLDIFSNFLFYLKVQSFRLIMENYLIQMAASAGHAVAYIDPILSTLSIVFSWFSPMALRIFSFKVSIVSGLSA